MNPQNVLAGEWLLAGCACHGRGALLLAQAGPVQEVTTGSWYAAPFEVGREHSFAGCTSPGCSQTALVNQEENKPGLGKVVPGPDSIWEAGACAWSRIRSFSALTPCSSLGFLLPRSPLTDQGGEDFREPENLGNLLLIISAPMNAQEKLAFKAAGQHWALPAAL